MGTFNFSGAGGFGIGIATLAAGAGVSVLLIARGTEGNGADFIIGRLTWLGAGIDILFGIICGGKISLSFKVGTTGVFISL